MFNEFYLIQLMIIYSTLFLFNKIPNFCARRQNFIQLVRFLFNNFRCPIGQRIGSAKSRAGNNAGRINRALEPLLQAAGGNESQNNAAAERFPGQILEHLNNLSTILERQQA